MRAAYAILVEQPTTSAAAQTFSNPPLATPFSFTGTVPLDSAINLARPAGNALITVDHNYTNSYIQSWNLNVQRELRPNLEMMLGYFGSKGTHLRAVRPSLQEQFFRIVLYYLAWLHPPDAWEN